MTKNNEDASLGYAIGRTSWYLRSLTNKLLKEGEYNITNEQWVVLKVIAARPAASQTEIAEKSLKDKTNITRILDLLEKNAYIERCKDDKDRRTYRIHITTEGEKVLSAVTSVTQKTNETCTRSFNEKEVAELIDSLNAVCMSIKKVL